MCKVGERARLAKEEWWCYMPVARFSEIPDRRTVTSQREETWNQQTVQQPVMGGAVDSSNGGSQPVHLTNRTSNANKQPPIAGAISFAEAKAALPRLPFASVPIHTSSSPIRSFLCRNYKFQSRASSRVEFRGVYRSVAIRLWLFCNVHFKNIGRRTVVIIGMRIEQTRFFLNK